MMPETPSTTAPAASPETHEMTLVLTHPSGAQHWRCPQCGRQTMLQRPGPQSRFKMIVLEAGNEQVAHVASTGALRVSTSAPAEFEAPPPGGLLH